jgi:hypothetical protein
MNAPTISPPQGPPADGVGQWRLRGDRHDPQIVGEQLAEACELVDEDVLDVAPATVRGRRRGAARRPATSTDYVRRCSTAVPSGHAEGLDVKFRVADAEAPSTDEAGRRRPRSA